LDAMHYILTSNCWFIPVFHIQKEHHISANLASKWRKIHR
jgi:hypothetical protein